MNSHEFTRGTIGCLRGKIMHNTGTHTHTNTLHVAAVHNDKVLAGSNLPRRGTDSPQTAGSAKSRRFALRTLSFATCGVPPKHLLKFEAFWRGSVGRWGTNKSPQDKVASSTTLIYCDVTCLVCSKCGFNPRFSK